MKVTKVEVVRSTEPIPLPEPWSPAWSEPSGKPFTEWHYAYYLVHTDEGITGVGPYTGAPPTLAEGMDPHHVGAFWEQHMGGARAGNSGKGAAGLEIALWDVIGKAAGQPIYKLLGAQQSRLKVYAATSRLLRKEEHVEQAQEIVAAGFRALKLRMHRQNAWDDLEVVAAVRDAVGDGIQLLVDANQNNASAGYNFWSRATAQTMARELEALGVYFLEEPLPRRDVEGLAEIAAASDMFIAGGEHAPTVFDYKEPVLAGAYDILQPDISMTGNFGIQGLRKVAAFADYFGRLVVPHVLSQAGFALHMAATLHAMATVPNCPMVEYPYDPPVLTAETTQKLVAAPLQVEPDGYVTVPDGPGLGVALNDEWLQGKIRMES